MAVVQRSTTAPDEAVRITNGGNWNERKENVWQDLIR